MHNINSKASSNKQAPHRTSRHGHAFVLVSQLVSTEARSQLGQIHQIAAMVDSEYVHVCQSADIHQSSAVGQVQCVHVPQCTHVRHTGVKTQIQRVHLSQGTHILYTAAVA